MSEKYNIVGKNIKNTDREQVENSLRKMRAEVPPIDGEYPKEGMLVLFTNKTIEFVEKELENIGIKSRDRLSIDKYHFLSQEAFSKRCKEFAVGFVDSYSKHIYLNLDLIARQTFSGPDYMTLNTLLHETIHSCAYEKYYIDKEKHSYKDIRSGYFSRKPNESRHDHFTGFNEAVTEMIIMKIIKKYKDEITEFFNLSEQDCGHEDNHAAQTSRDIVNIIIDRLAEYKGVGRREIWNRIQRGYFTGEMMYLRDVEKIFGEGSLRVLAAIDCGTKDLNDGFQNYLANQEILKYFKTDDLKERKRIAEEVLNEREKKSYLKNFEENST